MKNCFAKLSAVIVITLITVLYSFRVYAEEVSVDNAFISSAEIGAGLYSVDIRVGDSVTDSAKISIK